MISIDFKRIKLCKQNMSNKWKKTATKVAVLIYSISSTTVSGGVSRALGFSKSFFIILKAEAK